MVDVSGFAFGVGVATTAGDGVGAGVATTAGEVSIFGWFEFGVGIGAGVATTAGEASVFDESDAGVGVAILGPSGSASGWSALGVGSVAGLTTPARLLDSSALSFAVESPGLSSAAGAEIVDGIGAVFASEPTECTVAGCESPSAGGLTVSTFSTCLSASARTSLTAPRGINSRELRMSEAASRSRRRPSIANFPTFLMARFRAKTRLTFTNHGSSNTPSSMYTTATQFSHR